MTTAQFIGMTPAIVAAACALFVAWRNGKWRETDEAKALIKRMGEVEGRVDKVEGRVGTLEDDISDLPTKADIARLEGELKTVGNDVRAANAGIDRIEGFFLAKGVGQS
ncbi:DUF2730 family protein [Phenylobacterium sp.]|uniref:DUF2730 family protein n=1 Tax=Phenylobacterium sp. TaxID=1871053 RepID=UPI0035B2BA11